MLLGGVPGVPPADVAIIGGGIVGINAAKMAIGLGARVTILDTNLDRLRYLDDVFQGHHAGGPAVLVDHDGHVRFAALKFAQQFTNLHHLGHIERRPHHAKKVEGLGRTVLGMTQISTE